MYPEEFYDFEQFMEGTNKELIFAFAVALLIVCLVALIFVVVTYVLQSLGLYTIAKRRGIANPWLAWVPMGNYWIAGSLSDQYQYVVKGEVTNRRFLLLGLCIAGMVVSALISAMATGNIVLFVGGVSRDQLASLGAVGTLADLVTSGLEIATFVFWHIALYDLYTSFDPKNNTLYLVLGIIFAVTVPFFIFFNRHKEQGMPPRRDAQREYYEQEPEAYREPWGDI